ncbi:FadR/GntR family transcriptional regulator [Leifsonia poae]|uniref:FadR/GntR family transcriptional regulator n=1 Tax=Leifsonia poae TaxID=110933 RepID=UPI001CBB8FC0|nr:FCD domain-containing protein [Leifsonia poae]
MAQRELERSSLVGKLAHDLSARLAGAEWAPGDRLPSENVLAGEYGVGRSTVREAVRTLATRGQVEARQGNGVFVLSAHPVAGVGRMLSRADIAEVFEARSGIESEAARLAALRRTEEQLAGLTRIERVRTERGAVGGVEFVTADLDLHRAIVAASGNAVLLDLFDHFAPVLDRAARELERFDTGPRSPIGADIDEHAAILTAIARQDAPAAAEASRRLSDGTVRALRALALAEDRSV